MTGEVTPSLQRQAEQRNLILEVLYQAAARLLRGMTWEEHVPDILAQLGAAMDVSRVLIFTMFQDPAGHTCVRQSQEWCAPGVAPQLSDEALHHVPVDRYPFRRWTEILASKSKISLHVSQMSEDERRLFVAHDVRSVLIVPIFFRDDWWGFVGLHECRCERSWRECEIDGLRTTADLLGAAIHQSRVSDQLRETQERLALVIQGANLGLWDRNLITDDVVVNERVAGMLGYTIEEIYSDHKSLLDLVHPDDKPEAQQKIEAHLRGETPYFESEYRIRTKSGKWHWVLTTGKVMERRPDRTPVRFLGVQLDIHARKQNEELVRQLTRACIQAQEAERWRISADLHDNIAQDLSSLNLNLKMLLEQSTKFPPAMTDSLRQSLVILQKTITAVRNLAYDLRPPGLDQLGLESIVSRLCDDFSRKTGIPVDLTTAGLENICFDYDIRINLYRVIQEALANIRRHAGASLVTVHLVVSFPNLILRIQDDGGGFDVSERLAVACDERRMGLEGMRERISLLQGQFRIQSRPGEGTRISVKIPYAAAEGVRSSGQQINKDR
ncbi:MAG: PAS domain-containing protein [Acidobacteria bacterium]|nr:PAS domain-containing protein [Acidobacteriota bacterium]